MQVGTRVLVRSKQNAPGTIAYVGNLRGKSGVFYGVHLDDAVGKNDGEVAGTRYFACPANHGTFVREENLRVQRAARSQARGHALNDKYMDDFETAYNELGGRTGSPGLNTMHESKSTVVGELGFEASRLTGFREAQRPPGRFTPQWAASPLNAQGTVVDLSDRPILCSAVHRDRGEAVFGVSDHGVYVVDLASGKKSRQLHSKKYGHSEWVTSVDFCPSGAVLSGGMDKKICLWNANSPICIDLMGHSHSVSKVAVAADGQCGISSSYDKTLRLWGLEGRNRGRELVCLRGHKGPVLDFCVSGGLVCSGARDGVAMIWDMTMGCESSKYAAHGGHVTALACDPAPSHDDTLPVFFTGDQKGKIRMLDVRSRKPAAEAVVHPGGAVNELQYITHAGVLLCAGADNQMHTVDPRRGLSVVQSFAGHKDFIYSMKSEQDLVFSGSGNGMLLVHDMFSGELLYGLGANQAGVRCIEFADNVLVAAGDDGNAMLYQF